MTVELNKRLMTAIIEMFSTGDLSNAGGLIADDYVDHQATDRANTGGPDGFMNMVKGLRVAFPDLRVDIEDLIAEGDRVVVRLRWRGTLVAALGITQPTRTLVEAESIDIIRFESGQAKEHWGLSAGWP